MSLQHSRVILKSPAAYYLMLLYATVMVKPLLPVVNDFISHQFNGIEHISLVHALYGNQHLQNEIAESDSDKKGTRNQNIAKSFEGVSLHLVQGTNTEERTVNNIIIKFMLLNTRIPSFVLISNQGPPPKVCS